MFCGDKVMMHFVVLWGSYAHIVKGGPQGGNCTLNVRSNMHSEPRGGSPLLKISRVKFGHSSHKKQTFLLDKKMSHKDYRLALWTQLYTKT